MGKLHYTCYNETTSKYMCEGNFAIDKIIEDGPVVVIKDG